jgi:nucleoside-triphosphatase THEP1
MEMFSQKFKDAVMKTFNTQGVTLLTTIPIAKGKPIEFVETIRRRSDIKLFVLDKSNRDNVETEIINTILGL